MPRTRTLFLAALCLAALIPAGCQIAALVAGKGVEPAVYTLPKGASVLVLVDAREGVQIPPTLPTNLADKINAHLYKYRATDHLITQDRVLALEQADPERYKTMGIADIATAIGADVVLRVYITQFEVPVTSDGTVAQGDAELYVKVVDKHGTRLFPGEAAGVHVDAQAAPGYIADRETTAIIKQMTDILAMRTGRMFHAYSRDDADLTDQVVH